METYHKIHLLALVSKSF